jgi:DNA gyrase/topoisomerase IV subunit B
MHRTGARTVLRGRERREALLLPDRREGVVVPTSDYDPEAIRILSSAEVIRRRPEMYVGPLPDPTVLNRLVQEALCLSADAAVCGHCSEIAVAVHPTGVVTVRDNGPGLDVEPDRTGRVPAELLFTALGTCRAVKGGSAAAVCCQVGLVVVNALSEWLRVRVFRGGACWFQEHRAGVPLAPFRRERDADESGLELSFRPDAGILGPLEFDALALAAWLPSAGVRFGALDYRPARSVDQPVLLQFTEVGLHSDAKPAEPCAAPNRC